MSAACPVSWLALEQLALGELAVAERAAIDAHLADCAACRGRLTEIRGDVRPLPALVTPRRGRSRWWGVVPLALAAAALVAVRARPAPVVLPGPEIEVKGVVIAVTLVRERDGATNPDSWRPGDRFQVRVTCPPGAHVEIGVWNDGEMAFPLDAPECGNQVVAGAIALDGDDAAAICAVAGVPRAELTGPGALGDEAACAVVRPEENAGAPR